VSVLAGPDTAGSVAAATRGQALIGVAGGIAQQLTDTVCTLIILRWLTPADFGYWQVCLLIFTALLFMRLGVVNALNRDYPWLVGRGRDRRAATILGAALQFSAGLGALCLGALGLAATLAAAYGQHQWAMALLACGTFTASTLLTTCWEAAVRGGQSFLRLAFVQIALSAAAVLTLPLVAWGGFDGFCWRTMALALAAIVLYRAICPTPTPRWRIMRMALRWLLKRGMSMFFANCLSHIHAQGPRLALVLTADLTTLGLFGPVSSLLALGTAVSGRVRVMMFSQLNHRHGAGAGPAELIRSSWGTACVCALLAVPATVLALLVLPALVQAHAAAYAGGLRAMQLALLGLPLAALELGSTVLVTMRADRAWMKVSLLTTGMTLGGCLIAALLSPPQVRLEAVVAAALLARIGGTCAAWICSKLLRPNVVPA